MEWYVPFHFPTRISGFSLQMVSAQDSRALFRTPNQNKAACLPHLKWSRRKVTVMAGRSEDSASDDLCESSDSCDVSSLEINTSSKSIGEEESVPQSSRGKGKGKAKRAKTTESDGSTITKRPSKRSGKKEGRKPWMKTKWKTSHHGSSQQKKATKVQEHLRTTLVKDAGIKEERKRFAEHLLCDAEKQNFELLVSGFCRMFSTLAAESSKNNIPSYGKAAFSIAWMKFWTNFHPGKIIQEGIIVER